MKKSIIVAMSSNHAIGKDNKLLWHIPEDLKKFKDLTFGKHLIMGRKTWESIGRPLPGRTSIVITRNESYQLPDSVFRVSSLDEALRLAESRGEEEVMIAGGGEIYDQSMDICDTIYLTRLLDKFEGDTFFPAIDFSKFTVRDNSIDRVIYNNFIGDKKYDYEFMTLDRIV